MPQLRLVHSDEALDGARGLAQDFKRYLESGGYSPRTVDAYLSDCRLAGLLTDAPMTHEAHVVTAERVAGGSSAPRTRMRRLSSCARLYDFLVERDDPAVSGHPRNPYQAVRRPRLGIVMPNAVSTPEQSRRIVANLSSQGGDSGLLYAAAVAVMAGAGLRVSEASRLAIDDVDLVRRVIHVVDGKGRKSRDVPLSEAVATAIDVYLRSRPDRDSLTGADLLFPRSPRSIQRAVKAAASAVGADPRTGPHALRHGFGTAVYDKTRDLRLVADLLGHAAVTTTQIYVHLNDERRAESVACAL